MGKQWVNIFVPLVCVFFYLYRTFAEFPAMLPFWVNNG